MSYRMMRRPGPFDGIIGWTADRLRPLFARIIAFGRKAASPVEPGIRRMVLAARRSLPQPDDSQESRWLKIIVYCCVGIVLLMATSGLIVFSFSLEGPEQVMIPDVRGVELEDALISLQELELYGRIHLRFTSDPRSRGKVLDQRPPAGTAVKAGRRVTLVVSKGSVLDRVEDFVGKRLEEVHARLAAAFAGTAPLLAVKDPVMYVYNKAPAGTVLEQRPRAGVELSRETELELVVSRGPEPAKTRVPSLVGTDVFQAVGTLAASNIPFVFQPTTGGRPGVVLSQEPAAETEVVPGTVATLTFSPPGTLPEGRVFGSIDYSLPDYPVPVDLTGEIVRPNGERLPLFAMKHPGGRIAFPFMAEEQASVVISVFGREIIRHRVE